MATIYRKTDTEGNPNRMAQEEKSEEVKIKAENVVTSPYRQFVTQEEKEALASVLDIMGGTAGSAMYKQTYDIDSDGIVDKAEVAINAESVAWENIVNKPVEFDNVNILHSHDNKEILDKLSEDDNGKLLYDGNSFEVDLSSYMSKSLYDIDNDGIIDKAKYSESTNWDGILNKPLFYTPSSHTHSINDIDGEINATKLNGLNADQFLKKNDKITISQIEDISDWDFGLLEINGGTSSSTYEDTLNNESQITVRNDTEDFWHNNNPILKNCEIGMNSNDKRIKIGNGINKWNSLSYYLNTPSSVRFNKLSNDFISNCYNDINNIPTPSVSKYDISSIVHLDITSIQYNDTVIGYDDCVIGIPYNASNVLYYKDGQVEVFGDAIETLNSRGAGWYSGVYDQSEKIYCAPYNSNYILVINTKTKEVDVIGQNAFDSTKYNKYTRGTYCPLNGKIYFAPHNTTKILEIDPKNDSIEFYEDLTIFSSTENCCDVKYSPNDEKLYFIPKYGTDIIQFDPIFKTIKVVAKASNAENIKKFSNAILAPNGNIYIIPSFGYDYIVIFDPISYLIKEIDYVTTSYYDSINSVLAPNGNIYIIPSGVSNDQIIAFNIDTNLPKIVYSANSDTERWSGGALLQNGKIICLPYTSNSILTIDIKIDNLINSNALKIFR